MEDFEPAVVCDAVEVDEAGLAAVQVERCRMACRDRNSGGRRMAGTEVKRCGASMLGIGGFMGRPSRVGMHRVAEDCRVGQIRRGSDAAGHEGPQQYDGGQGSQRAHPWPKNMVPHRSV